jgi:hypothetical protein
MLSRGLGWVENSIPFERYKVVVEEEEEEAVVLGEQRKIVTVFGRQSMFAICWKSFYALYLRLAGVGSKIKGRPDSAEMQSHTM